jgi:hypothetical protein
MIFSPIDATRSYHVDFIRFDFQPHTPRFFAASYYLLLPPCLADYAIISMPPYFAFFAALRQMTFSRITPLEPPVFDGFAAIATLRLRQPLIFSPPLF